jgi:phosphatidylserine/phosphatidylglycerophosphate/cardiolipin synthase-like enzyme
MTAFDDQLTNYFVQATDVAQPGEHLPQTFQDCKITPLIDCAAYNAELDAALATVGTGGSMSANANHFIFVANWWLGLRGGHFIGVSSLTSSFGPQVQASSAYVLDPPDNTKVLIDILKAKAQAGVDVRVLGWVSFAVMDSNIAQRSGAGSIAMVNAMTMKSVKELRTEPELANKVMLNVISHTAGSAHNKIVVIGTDANAVGFTGGIDFDMLRFAHPGHPAGEPWHDVVAKVEGPAVQALYDHFKNMWQENLSPRRKARKFNFEGQAMASFVDGTPPINDRALTLVATNSKHHVQSVRTYPQFNYAWSNCLPENIQIGIPPEAGTGLFEYKLALRKAIQAAQSYIYIEDQAYWSRETLSWANSAIKNQPSLKVILLLEGGTDPNDEQTNDAPKLTQSINHGLLDGLTAAQLDQVRLFRRFGDPAPVLDDAKNPITVNVAAVTDETPTTALVTLAATAPSDIPKDQVVGARLRLTPVSNSTINFDVIGNPATTAGQPIVWQVAKDGILIPSTEPHQLKKSSQGVIVHAKTVLVDDAWAVIGSGNCMRRSLYTDIEHGVAFMDEDGNAVRDYRCGLWSDHFNHTPASDFSVLDEALHAWEPAWGTAGAAPTLPIWLEPVQLPVAEVAFDDKLRHRYDMYEDLDSRTPWGGLCP